LIETPFPASSRIAALGLFSPLVAFVLEPLGGGEQSGVDCRRTDRAADLPHGFARGIEKGAAGIFHQVPAIGAIRKALAARGISMAYTSIRHALGQLQARGEASVADDGKTWSYTAS
jgi:hypothetical protein